MIFEIMDYSEFCIERLKLFRPNFQISIAILKNYGA